MHEADRLNPRRNEESGIVFATVCDICGCLIPGVIMTPCCGDLVIIPHDLLRDWEAEKKFDRQVHRYCAERCANQPVTPELIADCRAVIQPLIEKKPDAYWGTADNPQLLSSS